MAGPGEGADVRARAEHIVLARADHNAAHLRVLEAQPRDRVGQFDIDAEIVGIELQLGAGKQTAGWIDVERQPRDRSVDVEPPMAVAGGVCREVDLHRRKAILPVILERRIIRRAAVPAKAFTVPLLTAEATAALRPQQSGSALTTKSTAPRGSGDRRRSGRAGWRGSPAVA